MAGDGAGPGEKIEKRFVWMGNALLQSLDLLAQLRDGVFGETQPALEEAGAGENALAFHAKKRQARPPATRAEK